MFKKGTFYKKWRTKLNRTLILGPKSNSIYLHTSG